MFSALTRRVLPILRQSSLGLSQVYRRQLHLTSVLANVPTTRDKSWDTIHLAAQPVIEQTAPRKSVDEIWAEMSAIAYDTLAAEPPADAYSGRSVKLVAGNFDQAWNRLNRIMAQNRVKHELRMTRRHEKKGYKRRRLASERWRKLFSNEVRKKVDLVRQIRYRNTNKH